MKLLISALLCMSMSVSAMADESDKFKALLVYKFTEYIVWPNSPAVIKVGVMGNSEVYEELVRFAARKDDLEVVKINNTEDADQCHLVYLSKAQGGLIRPLYAALYQKSILLVSEDKAHIQKGANAVIFLTDGKLSYIMNEQSITMKGMTPSKRLASLGQSL
ncbi:YfiR family protein [Reichenbachiella carrageenanivorans]|uniref:YfiR family protein n=1 Tax=Reichenbachiella carrageenanivorans TaxID=2979869 RepID=A0ABY6CWL2_9BACT|nr:YfiR family protein [Reichenbachiella carrageenanivorans]UXX78287.1 YfiR family protein [Reichenbachiella carrageenanivorans]